MLSKLLSLLTLIQCLPILAKRFGFMARDTENLNDNGTPWTGAPGDDEYPTATVVKPSDESTAFAGVASFLALTNLFS